MTFIFAFSERAARAGGGGAAILFVVVFPMFVRPRGAGLASVKSSFLRLATNLLNNVRNNNDDNNNNNRAKRACRKGEAHKKLSMVIYEKAAALITRNTLIEYYCKPCKSVDLRWGTSSVRNCVIR